MENDLASFYAENGYGRAPWDYSGRAVSSLPQLLTRSQMPALQEERRLANLNSVAGGVPSLADYWETAWSPYAQELTPGQQEAGGAARGPLGFDPSSLPAGWADIVIDPQNRIAWGVDASGNIIPGSNRSLATNDDRFGIAATLAFAGMGGAAAGAAGAGGAGAGEATTTGTVAGYGADFGAAAETGTAAGGTAAGAGTAAAPAATASSGGSSTPAAAGGGGSTAANAGGSLGARDYMSILSGLYGIYQGERVRDSMDPFAGNRGYFADRLMELERDPSAIQRRPGYQAGVNTINRELASKGYYGGGNHPIALSRFAGDFYNQEANRLAQLAGAGAAPGAGSLAAANLQGQGLASIAYGLAPYSNNRTQTGGGGAYYGGGYSQNPYIDPQGQNQGGP